MNQLGMYSENTIFSGVVNLASHGFWGIAIVVFVASVLVPILKIMGLIYLSLPAKTETLQIRTKLLHVLHIIGPWSMLDVFVVAVLISLVKLGDLANITTGAGLVAFTGVVVLTMIASYHFDARHDWLEQTHE
jgi:paraquat-inducible protein A